MLTGVMDFKPRITKISGNFRAPIPTPVFRPAPVPPFQYGGGLFGNWYAFSFYVPTSVSYMIDLTNKTCKVSC